jgi:predicted DNA-binding transcriptional regulator AlpA
MNKNQLAAKLNIKANSIDKRCAVMSISNLHGELPAIGYIRQAQLIPTIIPFSSATLWRKVKAGTFPAPVKLSSRVTAWPVEAIHAWMQARLTGEQK